MFHNLVFTTYDISCEKKGLDFDTNNVLDMRCVCEIVTVTITVTEWKVMVGIQFNPAKA